MPVKREVKLKVALPKKEGSGLAKAESKEALEVELVTEEGVEQITTVAPVRKIKCLFCSEESEPRYWDSNQLRRFISDRGRILPRNRTGVCSKHQKRVARQVKYARHLALIPYLIRA